MGTLFPSKQCLGGRGIFHTMILAVLIIPNSEKKSGCSYKISTDMCMCIKHYISKMAVNT